MSQVVFEAEAAAKTEHPRSTGAREFEAMFRAWPVAEAQAPGRVNLLGEHAGGGMVLAVAIPLQARVAMAFNHEGRFRLRTREPGRAADFTLDAEPGDAFACQVYGCLRLAREDGAEIPPLDIHVSSDVPVAAGLASGAALAVATLRCLRRTLGLELDDVRIAQLAQQVQVRFAGVRNGIVDAMACSLAGTETALVLDTRALERRPVPLPAGSAVLVLDAGVEHPQAADGRHERRAECEAAARALGLESLRDVPSLAAIDGLPQPLRRRARHVFTEDGRVRQAARCTDAAAFGELMNASHASLRGDYEVTSPQVDRLVELLQRLPGVHGARLTGFGGSCVALCRADAIHEVAHAALEPYRAGGHRGKLLVPASA